MEQGIRNQLPGTIKSIVSDKVLSEVIVDTSVGDVAVITTRSVEEMDLDVGGEILVLLNVAIAAKARQT